MGLAGKDTRLVPYGGNNYGLPVEFQTSFITPTETFFVRSNGPVPEVDPDAWRLEVGGLVDSPLSLSLAELHGFPAVTMTAFLECAGNSRTTFEPKAEGTPWHNDAISNATWTGTPLAGILAQAGVKSEAVEIVCQGLDFAEMRRGLPIANALDPSTLLVWEMNGAPLTVPHGAPVRLLVPGWGGIASTKWLASLMLVDRPFTGFYNANNYVMTSATGEKLAPVREMPPKSIIVEPASGASLPAGKQRVRGFAWSGLGDVARVEVSVDGGDWFEAAIDQRAGRFSWVEFSFDWNTTPGSHEIRSRATDARELTQPEKPNWNAKGYQMNAIQAVNVTVA